MLVRRGVGDAGAGAGIPWQCGWIPFYAGLHPDLCKYLPSPSAPAAPVIPAGSLDPRQNPAGPAGGGSYSTDQVAGDTAAKQRGQTQQFFSDVADTLTSDPVCDPDAFWCNYKNAVILGALGVGALVVLNLVKGVSRQ